MFIIKSVYKQFRVKLVLTLTFSIVYYHALNRGLAMQYGMRNLSVQIDVKIIRVVHEVLCSLSQCPTKNYNLQIFRT